MHPAALLLNLVALSIMYMAPVVGWYMLRQESDRNSNLWFAGALIYAFGASLFAFQGVVDPRWASQASLLCSWVTLSIFDTVLRSELGYPARSRLMQVLAALLWGVACHLAWSLGGRLLMSPFSLLVLGLFEVHLLVLVRRLHQRTPSRGLTVLGLGLGMIALVNFIRVTFAWIHDQPQDLLDFSWFSNLLLVITFLSVICYSMGYWGYLFEKLHLGKLAASQAAVRASEREKVADEYASRLEQLVQQRDRMVVVSSRFSTLNTLTVFNAGIVHEISQPLQGILTAVEMLAMELRTADRMDLAHQADDITRMTLKISQVLDALRRLMQFTPPQTERVPLHNLVGDCLPIIASECRYRGVSLELELPPTDAPGFVVVNPVLMERVLLNLSANALESLESVASPGHGAPSIRLVVRRGWVQGRAVAQVVLTDNGPGLKDIPADMFVEASAKPTGLGVGLQIVRALVAHWRGSIDIQSQTEGASTGTTVTLALPLLEA